jgi:hypothetical protein
MALASYLDQLLSLKLVGFLLTHFTMVALLAPWAWIDSLEPFAADLAGPNGMNFRKVRVYLSLWTTQLDEFTDEEDENIWQTIRICVPLALVLNIVEYLGINVWESGTMMTGFHHAVLAMINALALVFMGITISLYAASVDDMFEHLHTYDETTFGALNDNLEKMYFLAGPIAGFISLGLLFCLSGLHTYMWWRT